MQSFLAKLVHDLNNPLGTLSMDLFNSQAILERLDAALQRGDLDASRQSCNELLVICKNLSRAFQQTHGIVSALKTSVDRSGAGR